VQVAGAAGVVPPKATAEDIVPAPAKFDLAVIKFPLVDHTVDVGIKGTYILVGVFATGLEAVISI
jgi:hypothetical protein